MDLDSYLANAFNFLDDLEEKILKSNSNILVSYKDVNSGVKPNDLIINGVSYDISDKPVKYILTSIILPSICIIKDLTFNELLEKFFELDTSSTIKNLEVDGNSFVLKRTSKFAGFTFRQMNSKVSKLLEYYNIEVFYKY